MHIKHWAGYGLVTAKLISKTVTDGETILVVKVSGNHEQGLVRTDLYTLKSWLVDKFDRAAKDISPYSIEYDYLNDYETTSDGLDEEYCIYTFRYTI